MRTSLVMPRIKVAYIASPVKAFYQSYAEPQKAISEIKKYAISLCEVAKTKGYIPLSTPIAFIEVYDENKEREWALNAGMQILKKCDAFFYYKDDLSRSEGMRNELEIAKELNLEVIEIDKIMKNK